jgi:hypothetical protein
MAEAREVSVHAQDPYRCGLWSKRHGREADHSSPPSVEVKNAWRYTTISTYSLIPCPLITHTDTCTSAVCLLGEKDQERYDDNDDDHDDCSPEPCVQTLQPQDSQLPTRQL